MHFVNRKTWCRHFDGQSTNRKGEALRFFRTEVFFDDNLDICEEVSDEGRLPYHISSRGCRQFCPQLFRTSGIERPSSFDFLDAVVRFLTDYSKGLVVHKITVIQKNAVATTGQPDPRPIQA